MICAGILGAQVSVMGNIFQTFIGMPSYIGIIIGFGIVLIYSTIGGIKADIVTDIIQFFILIIGLPFLVIYGIKEVGGISNIAENIPTEYWNILNNMNLVAFISAFLVSLFARRIEAVTRFLCSFTSITLTFCTEPTKEESSALRGKPEWDAGTNAC